MATLPAGERKEAEDAIAAVEKLSPQSGSSFSDPVPADLWVDEEGLTRRLVSTAKLPAQGGQPGGTVRQTYELSDFGVALDAAPPAAEDTYDATGAAARLLEQTVTSGGTTP